MVGVDHHTASLILQGPNASFYAAGLMMRIYSGVGKTLAFAVTIVLPLPAGKNSIVSVIVAYFNAIGGTVLLKSCFSEANVIAALRFHEVHIAKIQVVIAEYCHMLVALTCQKASHLGNKSRC
jgi:hypothetical protein